MGKYYLAYGSNLNLKVMKMMCPKAKVVGKCLLNDCRLVFRGGENCSYLTVEPAEGYSVPVGIFKLGIFDESKLDFYESFPELYHKKEMDITINNKKSKAMIYLMNSGLSKYQPDNEYLNTCREGYVFFGFDQKYLDEALEYSKPKIYKK